MSNRGLAAAGLILSFFVTIPVVIFLLPGALEANGVETGGTDGIMEGLGPAGTALKYAGLLLALGTLVLFCLGALLVKNRLDARERRHYSMYLVYLSMHDLAKEQDLEDMVEALAGAVREFPEQRARTGQPFFAIDLVHGPSANGEMEWTLVLWCETDLVGTLESAIANAYPDVRVGSGHATEPLPIPGRLWTPSHVLRFRKARSFIYSLSRETDAEASPPMEAIAQTQITVPAPSVVRLQFIPAPINMEDWARRKYKRHEDSLVRSETWGLPNAGLRGTLNQEEMREAKLTQNRAMFWMEVQVAADTRENANRIASALTARRAENNLHRRWMTLRVPLYCARFPDAYPPLLPTVGFGRFNSLVSSAEAASLLQFPTARMKGVPVRRTTIPRLPAPPEIAKTADIEPATPVTSAEDAIDVLDGEIV